MIRIVLFVALVLPAGCAAADRESYSLAFARKSHEYADPGPPPAPKTEIVKEYEELTRVAERRGFRPFAFCTLHQTDHFAESLLAVGAAPVEYPLVLGVNTGSLFLQSTVGELARILGFFGPADQVELPYRKGEHNR